MKLTVIDERDVADVLKAKIATFANSQNSIQQSDLVSNHQFHINIETRSRKQLMPPGDNGLSTKWFYERARGQYSTKLRALNTTQKRRFDAEYPKKQVFTKTDMAKYENTWRMKPYQVKKGAQANLKALGAEIITEFEKDENAFGPAFYNDLVSKMIIFREIDIAILKADWYREERGLKAEIVTYSIALLRDKLLKESCDINLAAIYKRQGLSSELQDTVVFLAQKIRKRITDFEFTDGVTNPSEFCKSEKGWKKIQTIDVDLKTLGVADVLSAEDAIDAKKENREINEDSKSIKGLDYVMSVSMNEWYLIVEHYLKIYPSDHMNVAIPRKCAELHRFGKMLSDKQMTIAKKIRDVAYKEGFDFVS